MNRPQFRSLALPYIPILLRRPILNKSHTSTKHEESMPNPKVLSVTWEQPDD